MAETRTHWKDDEWQLVCAELYKMKPFECRSSTMIGISASDMIAAMHKALPKARWRLSMNMTKTRPKLIEHMLIFLQIHDAEIASEQAKIKQQAAEKENNERDILMPVAKLLADLMFEHLRPLLDNYLVGKVPMTNQPADAVLSHHRELDHVRKPKIGIIGLLPGQGEMLKSQFPQLDFKFVEKGTNSEEVRGLYNMDSVFGLTQKMAHNAEYVLKKSPIWERYHRVSGKGPSALKRAISIWMLDSTTRPTNSHI